MRKEVLRFPGHLTSAAFSASTRCRQPAVLHIEIQLTDLLWIPVDAQRAHEIVVPAGIVGSEKLE
jgi:hypothetical protein